MTTPERFVWTDIETTGLSAITDVVLEIGIRITDLDMKEIDSFEVQIWDSPYFDRKYDELRIRAGSGDVGAKIVFDMHTKSGLWDDCRSGGVTPEAAEKATVDFLVGHGVTHSSKEPICGSSVHFDRTFLNEDFPAIHNCFGYRNIDVSTVKELCMRLNPELYKKLDKFGPPKREIHRALPDLEDTANELVWYGENFLYSTSTEMNYS